MKTYYVYTYKTPIDIYINSNKWYIPAGSIFYVGKGYGKRKYDHLTENPNKIVNHIKHGIIQKIKKQGLHPIIEEIVTDIHETHIIEQEIFYIAKLGKLINGTGYLSNITDGGQGTSGWIPSKETRDKWSAQRKGRVSKNKGIKRPGIGGRPKGIPWSVETRKKIMKIRNQPGYYNFLQSSSRREKISKAKKGKPGTVNGKIWYNNGIIEKYATSCPVGFLKGRLKRKTNGKAGMLWYTNGVVTKQFKENMQPEGWSRGRIIKK